MVLSAHYEQQNRTALVSRPPPDLYNVIEPAGLIQHFLAAPPYGFRVQTLPAQAPGFVTPFDLLTTMDPSKRRRFYALPFARWWRRFLTPSTCFVGTTVSEYAPLPRSAAPGDFVRALLADVGQNYPFLIVKDLPTDAVLVGDAAWRASRALAAACTDSGFVLMEGQALAYVLIDFPSIEAYLARMSKVRRKDLKRKLKAGADLQVDVVQTGDAMFRDETVLANFYVLYKNVYEQSEIHFDLLSEAFLRRVLQDGTAQGVVFVYRVREELIGYNICFVEGQRLIDKYVGFLYPQAREHNLYAVSWFRNLDYALANGLQCYVAGWTDPEIKRYLGARFSMTQHAVYVRNRLLRRILRSFRRLFESDHRWHLSNVPDADS